MIGQTASKLRILVILVIPYIYGCNALIDSALGGREKSDTQIAIARINAKIAETRRAIEDEERREVANQLRTKCTPPWGYVDAEGKSKLDSTIVKFAENKDVVLQSQDLDTLNTKFVPFYKTMTDYSELIPHLKRNGCSIPQLEQFDAAWLPLPDIEKRRLALIEVENAKELAEIESDRNKVRKQAMHLGYKKVLFGGGLLENIRELFNSGKNATSLRGVLIELNGEDQEFYIHQVLPNHKALVMHHDVDVVVLLEGYSGQMYENGDFSSMNFGYAEIIGVKNYTTVLGSSRQAFIVKSVF